MAFSIPLLHTLASSSAGSHLNILHLSNLPHLSSPQRIAFPRGRPITSASLQNHPKVPSGQSPCTCCSRRAMLTSLGGAMLANNGTSHAAAAAVEDADMIREAVHPARPGWYEELYARLMNSSMRSYEAEIAGLKRELFARLDDDNMKTVVELGIGTGPNLTYYGGRPSIATVIGVDPNAKMARYAEAAAVAAGLSPAQFKFMHAVGEGLPVPSASVDAVISTLVLCSVSDVSKTLKEVQRVLRPGGMFLFVEHVAAPEGDSLRFWQNLLDPVQQLVADGCHLKRDTLGSIEAAQFATVDARRVTVKGMSLFAPHVVGSACTAMNGVLLFAPHVVGSTCTAVNGVSLFAPHVVGSACTALVAILPLLQLHQQLLLDCKPNVCSMVIEEVSKKNKGSVK